MNPHTEKIENAISHIEGRLRQIKSAMEELLSSLDMQEHASYPDMISKYSSLASEFSALQTALRKSALPAGNEDNGTYLKSHLMVPQRNVSEGRLVSWNHEVVPVYLRTKLNPDAEADEQRIENERLSRQTSEHVNKQIGALNKHIESLSTRLTDPSRQNLDRHRESPAYSNDHTTVLVKAICRGVGIQPKSNMVASASASAAASVDVNRLPNSGSSSNLPAERVSVPIVKLKQT
ncbi:mediator of RNA polymerase II transcription complex subunit 8 domain-containing protein [Ditylenchus destructor]|uniref:Mediator of RNA polymerase II transcription subunit 8 n=1 Tax=Ditylenchus destructor TaxID=166010 RepID=A0AAD4NI04_9BILA|nr:mediator of RNA polymerase II transcription complex subunit 8 domain-containing protein [Ditylenchus destructor]